MTTATPRPARTVRGMDEVGSLVGHEIGVSSWFEITQSDVSAFARFTAPLRVGSRVRARMTLKSVQNKPDGSLLGLTEVFEREGAERPVCVAQFLLRFVGTNPRET